jgi:hypothetical protein
MIEDSVTENASPTEMDDFDPHLARVAMPLRQVYFPLGFPLELTTNSEAVIAAADESWGAFTQKLDIPPLQVQIGVRESDAAECPPASTFRALRNILTNIADNENFCINDLRQGFSFAWVTTAAVSRRLYFRYHFLEPVALAHIANRYTAPVHAACVEMAGSGVMLCGESGAGKSSLAFACARAGWTYITDDACYLLTGGRELNMVGNCHSIRLRPSAAALFLEIADKPLTPRAAAGKPSIELQTASLPEINCAATSRIDHVVFLRRRDVDIQELVPFSKEAARRFMRQHLTGQEEVRQAQLDAIERLLAIDVLELRYSDMTWAINRLERLVREKA